MKATTEEVQDQESEVSVSFTPSQAGQYQVSVTFRGKHLQGSPLNLEVVDQPIYHRDQSMKPYSRDYRNVGDQPLRQFSSKGAGNGQFINPYSVACNVRGEIVVADYSNHRIQVFGRNGKFWVKWK